MMELLYRSSQMLDAERDHTLAPKNDYSAPFTTSLNFNFNTNDVFGSAKKMPNSLIKSKDNCLTAIRYLRV
jgi:hypothetical protein